MADIHHKVNLEKIKRLRKEKSISIEKMSQMVGYESPNGYYYIEKGRVKCPAETLSRIADVLGVPITELFFTKSVAKMATNENSSVEAI